MLGRVDLAKLRALFATPSAKPVYVLNVIDFADFSMYRIYGLFVLPMILATGGGVRWGGRHREAIYGEPIGETVLMVRYLTHQRFLLMGSNPFFLAINTFRTKGVARFEASFSRVVDGSETVSRRHDRVVGVHFNDDEPQARMRQHRELLEPLGLTEVLAIEEYRAIDFLQPPAPNDPNPHTYKSNQFFAVPGHGIGDEVRTRLEALGAELGACSIQLYKRSNPREYLPGTALPKYTRRAVAG